MCVRANKRFYSILWSEYNFYVKKSRKKIISKSVFCNLDFCIRGLIWIFLDFGRFWMDFGAIINRNPYITPAVLEFTRLPFCLTRSRFRVVLEAFSEAESAPIRSAVKIYFDLDVRIFFQLFQKTYFRSIKKKVEKNLKKWKIFKVSKNRFFEIRNFDFFLI